MLYYARTYKTDQNNFQSFWYYDYGVENPEEMLLSLEQRGFICPASARESVNNLKVNELKELLKELGSKVTGRKEELATRIVENASDEWLEGKIKNRPYKLTDLALQELEENKYIPYFHKAKIRYGVDVWWINQQLYIHNYPKSLYRDLIYGELNRKLNETMIEIQRGYDVSLVHYGCYKKQIGEFLMEENKFNDAFNAIAEYAYYITNSNLLPYINHGIEYVSERIISIDLFQKLKNELGLSNDDVFQKLINFYNMLNFPAPFAILSNQDIAGLIISLMNGENEIFENLFNELETNAYAKIRTKFDNPVHRQSIDILDNNDLSSSTNTQISTQPEQPQKNINISEQKINKDPNSCTQEQKDPLHGWDGCLGCLGCILVLLLIICLIVVAIKLFITNSNSFHFYIKNQEQVVKPAPIFIIYTSENVQNHR